MDCINCTFTNCDIETGGDGCSVLEDKMTHWFSAPCETKEQAQALHDFGPFHPATVFQMPNGKYVMALLRDWNWPPNVAPIEKLTGYKAVSFCDAVCAVWKDADKFEKAAK